MTPEREKLLNNRQAELEDKFNRAFKDLILVATEIIANEIRLAGLSPAQVNSADVTNASAKP
jgi:hypothetical protein